MSALMQLRYSLAWRQPVRECNLFCIQFSSIFEHDSIVSPLPTPQAGIGWAKHQRASARSWLATIERHHRIGRGVRGGRQSRSARRQSRCEPSNRLGQAREARKPSRCDGKQKCGQLSYRGDRREVRVTSNEVTTPLSKPMTINPAKISRTAPMAT